jgi:hypothetical protein
VRPRSLLLLPRRRCRAGRGRCARARRRGGALHAARSTTPRSPRGRSSSASSRARSTTSPSTRGPKVKFNRVLTTAAAMGSPRATPFVHSMRAVADRAPRDHRAARVDRRVARDRSSSPTTTSRTRRAPTSRPSSTPAAGDHRRRRR